MNDFDPCESPQEITEKIKGKTVERCEYSDGGMDDFIVLVFSGGTKLRIRYDYIYEWEFIEK
jgi:hypothetical protein